MIIHIRHIAGSSSNDRCKKTMQKLNCCNLHSCKNLMLLFMVVLEANYYSTFCKATKLINKRPTGLNGHLSIRDFTLNSCQKGAYLYLSSIIIINKNQQLYRKAAS